jgi:hypothetical protein
MVRPFYALILAALVSAAALAGCAAGPMVDQLPGEMGLPKGAPARPETSFQYPAVHDMPPPRATAPMNDEEQFKLEKELRAVRDRQESQEGKKGKKGQDGQAGATKMAAPPASKKSAPLAEKQPSNAIVVPPAGVKTNP